MLFSADAMNNGVRERPRCNMSDMRAFIGRSDDPGRMLRRSFARGKRAIARLKAFPAAVS